MSKTTVKLNKKQLENIIAESVTKMLNEYDYSDFDFSKTSGLDISDYNEGFTSPAEIKQKLLNLQNALDDVMNLFNGNAAGDNFCNELERECMRFHSIISQYYIELKHNVRCGDGSSWDEDHSDIPFIRKYDDDCSIPNYYDKNGNTIDPKRFRTNYKKN